MLSSTSTLGPRPLRLKTKNAGGGAENDAMRADAPHPADRVMGRQGRGWNGVPFFVLFLFFLFWLFFFYRTGLFYVMLLFLLVLPLQFPLFFSDFIILSFALFFVLLLYFPIVFFLFFFFFFFVVLYHFGWPCVYFKRFSLSYLACLSVAVVRIPLFLSVLCILFLLFVGFFLFI